MPPAPTAPATTPQPTPTTPEATPGGGGEEPARTELTFTATSRGVSPRHVNVAPYVAVRVALASRDGSAHRLVIRGKALAVGGTRKSAFLTLPGLPPGGSYSGRVDGRTPIRITSSGEPGP